jgi:hypothetical protein
MHPRFPLINRFALLAWLFVAPAFANADEGSIRIDLTAPDSPEPLITASTSDGGLWVVASVSGNPSQHQLLRLDANGNRTVALLLPNGVDSDNAERFALYPLADGGVLELDTIRPDRIESSCLLRSITRAGVVRFERNVRQSDCKLKLGKSGGAPYLVSNIGAARLISEDGSLASSFVVPGDVSLIAAEFVGADREVLLMTRFPSGSGYVYSRMGENGAMRWSKPLEGVSGNLDVSVRGLADGRAMILVFETDKLQQRFYSTEGLLIETREIALPALQLSDRSNWAQDSQGNHALLLRRTGSMDESFGAILFASNGSFIKLVRYAPTDECSRNCQLLGLTQGFAVALRTRGEGKLVLISALSNVANVEVPLPGDSYPRIANGGNDSIVVSGSESLRAISHDGVALPVPTLIGKGIAPRSILGTAIAENGWSFVLSLEFTDGDFKTQLEAFDSNRVKLWKINPGSARDMNPLADSQRVCLLGGGEAAIKCYDSRTGASLGSATVPLNLIGMRARMLSDGRLRIISIDSIGLEIFDFSRTNQITKLRVDDVRVESIQDISDSGSVLLTNRVSAANVVSFEWSLILPNGQIGFRRPTGTGFSQAQFPGRIVANDDVFLVFPNRTVAGNAVNVVLVDKSGMQRWTVSKTGELPFLFADAGKDIYLIRRNFLGDPRLPPASELELQALSFADGRNVWTQRFKGLQNSDAYTIPSRGQNQVLLALTNPLGTLLHRISDIDGQILEQRFLDCAAATCGFPTAAVDRLGTFRTISEAISSGRSALVLAEINTAVTKSQIRIDQLGISGAWYTPQLTGQGFFFEYFPQNKQLFAPWFTFEPESFSVPGLLSDSVSDLRWYSLNGTVAPDAKEVQLEIRSNVAGVFDSAPITRSSIVGTATLRAQDCNNATLEFKFNESEADGTGGVLPLSRLTGGWAPCQTGANTTQPGRDARPARGGFAGNQAGSWYAPQTSGQGFMFNVKPATATEPGDFFGGWFTYDAGTPNDPSTQHWLALSGTIPSNAQAGVLPVSIYRVLGGELARKPTQNTAILGQGTITFAGCNSAVFRYQFNDALIAGPFRARTGSINLQRLGACPGDESAN